MTLKLKVVALGRLIGIELPKQLLERLGVSQGDSLHVTEVPDGIKLTQRDPEFEEQMRVAESVMRDDREVLKRLAKD